MEVEGQVELLVVVCSKDLHILTTLTARCCTASTLGLVPQLDHDILALALLLSRPSTAGLDRALHRLGCFKHAFSGFRRCLSSPHSCCR
jgi:hypothetical protein